MLQNKLRLVGVELYFENLETAKQFYRETLGLDLSDEQAGHYARFDADARFVCLERKGSESYPSLDKAVVFFEVTDLEAALSRVGHQRFVHYEPGANSRPGWAVLHDPEGHNVLLLQAKSEGSR